MLSNARAYVLNTGYFQYCPDHKSDKCDSINHGIWDQKT
jgi:hypothetical protein